MSPRRSKRVPAAPRSPALSAEHKHLSALLVALIVLCCVGFLVVYYKIDSDYANQSADFDRLEQRLDTIQSRFGIPSMMYNR